MHYRIRGKLIASEFAAKSPSQASSHLLKFLLSQNRVATAVDYGCGKLRYAEVLSGMADSLTLVDSAIQFDRQQWIDGEETTVRQLAKERFPTARIETISEFQIKLRPKFDFALCANVLSAIPLKAERSRALVAIGRRLKVHGKLLVVNQHTNSYFSQMLRRDDITRQLDGWIIHKGNFASYFGILNQRKTSKVLQSVGYEIIDYWIEGQSNYVLVRVP